MKKQHSIELFISKFLTFGIILCGAIIFSGWILSIKLQGNPFFNFEIYDRIPLQELLQFYINKGSLIQLTSYLGFTLLISIPFIRVAIMSFLYLKTKEYLLALISILVLTGLISGIFLGIKV